MIKEIIYTLWIQIYMVNKSIKTYMGIITIKFMVVGRENEVRSGRDFKDSFQCCVF